MSFLKSIWKTNSRHQKLPEEISLNISKDSVNESIGITEEDQEDIATFKLKYLGSKVIEKVVGENINIQAVKSILNTVKSEKKKLQRVNVAISLKGIDVTDNKGNGIFKISIYRISNCSTYAAHRQVFSFISTDEHETMECHAFFCSKRKVAETVTLTVANTFSTAFEAWKILPQTKEFSKNFIISMSNKSENNGDAKEKERLQTSEVTNICGDTQKLLDEKLIDFDDEPSSGVCADGEDPFEVKREKEIIPANHWVSFDDFPSEPAEKCHPLS